jgi:hypothetical protein
VIIGLDYEQHLVEYLDLMGRGGISDTKLRKILAYVERVVSEPD